MEVNERGVRGDPEPQSSLRTVEVAGLRQEVSEALRRAIWDGVLRPGERLNEQRLAAELGVSRPPLREAIRVLEQEGLLVSVLRRGSFVRVLTGRDIAEIYTVRCALESMAAELAIHAAPEELDRLEAMVTAVESRPPSDLRPVIDDDLVFHHLVMILGRNLRLVGIWEQLAGQIRLALTLVDPAFFERDYVEITHRPLVAAIRRRDVPEIQRLSRMLLDVGRDLEVRWDEQVQAEGYGTGATGAIG